MNSEKRAMSKGKKSKGKEDSGLQLTSKTCLDCLNCKVSAKSNKKHTLCFCAKAEKKVNHRTPYWQEKKLCENFENMAV
jgi:hypothetical protein